LNPKYLYLVIDLAALSLPFLFSFYPRANFSRKWKYLGPALLFPAVFFLLWDEWFTSMGVWGFNPSYITGLYLFKLPLEEVLFFFCIPYACVFTYEAVGLLIKRDYVKPYSDVITNALIVSLLVAGILNTHRWYTTVTFTLCALFLLFVRYKLKADYLSRFYVAYLFILLPFFIVNGILTGTGLESPVVWYNADENLGIRLGTIPLEDAFYGMLLILMNITLFEFLQARDKGI